MKKLIVFLLLLGMPSILFTNDIKLGKPLKLDFYDEYYGEEETVTQEGDYSNVYANYEERYILYDLNLYRLAPQLLDNEDTNTAPDVKKCINWGYCFQPTKPLYWNVNLSRSARYHDDDMIKHNCFAHNDCDGGDIWARIRRYYSSSAMGENIAAGSPYNEVTKNFINEKGAPPGTVGHRENVFSPDFNEVGLGYLLGGSYRMYTTQDFGASAKFTVIPVAIHEPKKPSNGATVKFKAIYYKSTQNSNPKVYLVLNDKEIEMQKTISSLDWKSDNYVGKGSVVTRNWYSAEYTVNRKITAECDNYYIKVNVDDKDYYYPDNGSLLVGPNCGNKLYDTKRYSEDNNEGNNGNTNDNPEAGGCSFGNSNNNYIFYFMFLVIFYLRKKSIREK